MSTPTLQLNGTPINHYCNNGEITLPEEELKQMLFHLPIPNTTCNRQIQSIFLKVHLSLIERFPTNQSPYGLREPSHHIALEKRHPGLTPAIQELECRLPEGSDLCSSSVGRHSSHLEQRPHVMGTQEVLAGEKWGGGSWDLKSGFWNPEV